jgi:hypothetical protein
VRAAAAAAARRLCCLLPAGCSERPLLETAANPGAEIGPIGSAPG